jgi:hypothetical protein
MNSAALAVVAALGASALTGVTPVVGLRERLRRNAADRQELNGAVTQMLSRSMDVSLRAQAMG